MSDTTYEHGMPVEVFFDKLNILMNSDAGYVPHLATIEKLIQETISSVEDKWKLKQENAKLAEENAEMKEEISKLNAGWEKQSEEYESLHEECCRRETPEVRKEREDEMSQLKEDLTEIQVYCEGGTRDEGECFHRITENRYIDELDEDEIIKFKIDINEFNEEDSDSDDDENVTCLCGGIVMTQEEFAERYGLSTDDIDEIPTKEEFAKRHGLSIEDLDEIARSCQASQGK